MVLLLHPIAIDAACQIHFCFSTFFSAKFVLGHKFWKDSVSFAPKLRKPSYKNKFWILFAMA